MKLIKSNEIYKIYSNDNEVFYGSVGTVENLIKQGIMTHSGYPSTLFCFMPALGTNKHQFYAVTLDDIIRGL